MQTHRKQKLAPVTTTLEKRLASLFRSPPTWPTAISSMTYLSVCLSVIVGVSSAGKREGSEEAELHFQIPSLLIHWGSHQRPSIHQSLQVILQSSSQCVIPNCTHPCCIHAACFVHTLLHSVFHQHLSPVECPNMLAHM